MKKIFTLNEDNMSINVHSIYINNSKLDRFLDNVTKELGCIYSDISPDIPTGYEKKLELFSSRKVCISKFMPKIYRYYTNENDFIFALLNCYSPKPVGYHDVFGFHKVPNEYPNNVIDFNYLYQYLMNKGSKLDESIENYVLSFIKYLNVNYDKFYTIDIQKLDYNSDDAKILLELVEYYNNSTYVYMSDSDKYDEIDDYDRQEYMYYPKKKVLTLADNNTKILNRFK